MDSEDRSLLVSLARGMVRHKATYEIRKGNSQPMNVQVPYIQFLRLASSVHYRYSDYGMTWDYPGKHAAFATFHAQPSSLPK